MALSLKIMPELPEILYKLAQDPSRRGERVPLQDINLPQGIKIPEDLNYEEFAKLFCTLFGLHFYTEESVGGAGAKIGTQGLKRLFDQYVERGHQQRVRERRAKIRNRVLLVLGLVCGGAALVYNWAKEGLDTSNKDSIGDVKVDPLEDARTRQAVLDALARDITVPCPQEMQAEFVRVRGLLRANSSLLDETFKEAEYHLGRAGLKSSDLSAQVLDSLNRAECLKIPVEGDFLWDPNLMNTFYGDSLSGDENDIPPDYVIARAFRPNPEGNYFTPAIAFREYYFTADDCRSSAGLMEEGVHLLGYEHTGEASHTLPNGMDVLSAASDFLELNCATKVLTGSLQGFRGAKN